MNLKRFVARGICLLLCLMLVAAITPAKTYSEPPSPRAELPLAYDSKTNQVLMFGGVFGDMNQKLRFNNQTWIYDVAENTWTQVKPLVSPGPRDNVMLAYDSTSDVFVLFGGTSGNTPETFGLQDTWIFDMKTLTWTQKENGPPNHGGGSMVYDSKADRMLLFGGFDYEKNEATNDLWSYDYNTDTWTELTPAISPVGRNYPSMAYDSKADKVILYGGWGTVEPTKDLWVYDYNTNTWTQRELTGGPSSWVFQNISYDSISDRILLYGGYSGAPPAPFWDYSAISSETWAYDVSSNSWTQLTPAGNPGPIMNAGQVYLPSIDRLFLFGGRRANGNCTNKSWLYDYSANTWTQMTLEP